MDSSKKIDVFETRDYSKFKKLVGNRDVTNKRVAIIKESIKTVGYISNPIKCNENMEVIDGQGRLEALKQLELPVEYTIEKGLGINECRAMNLKPTAWTINDFIKSYAEYGVESYIRILKLQEKYGFSASVLYAITKRNFSNGTSPQDNYRNGTLVVTDEEYEISKETCEYLVRFIDVQKKIGGKKDLFFESIAFVSNLKGVDKERLYYSITQNVSEINPASKSEYLLKDISNCYNKGYAKKNRRYFDYEKKTII